MGQQSEVVDAPTGPQKAVENMGGRSDQVLFKPAMAVGIGKDDTAVIGGFEKGLDGGGSGLKIAAVAGIAPRAHEQGDALTLCETGVPRRSERRAIVPVEVV